MVCLIAPFLACATWAQEPPQLFTPRPGHLEFSGRMIARPVQDNPVARAAARAEVQDWILHEYSEVDEFILIVPEGQNENSFAAQLMASGDWEYVHPDWICYPLVIPNDPLFGDQWHHTQIQSAEAWDWFHSAPTRIAAWTDTGVDTDHVDLVNQLIPGYNAVDRLTQEQGGDLEDINGHGTVVGGTIGATGNNGEGVAGVVWDIQLLPVRVSNDPGGGAYLSDLEHGARWAVDNGASTISASYSGVEYSSVQTTGAYVRSMGGLYLYAAGNDDVDHSGFDWDDVVVVGASDENDDKAWFSSYGTAVDLTAPGLYIWATEMGGGYRSASGTSLSTPIANGVAALMWGANPFLSSHELEQRIYAACDDIGEPGEDNVFGHGRANLRKGVEHAFEGNLSILTPNLVAGSWGHISVDGAAPGQPVYLGYSTVGSAIQELPLLQTSIGLISPQLADQRVADANGHATFHRYIPIELMGQAVWLQAAVYRDTSQVDARMIQ